MGGQPAEGTSNQNRCQSKPAPFRLHLGAPISDPARSCRCQPAPIAVWPLELGRLQIPPNSSLSIHQPSTFSTHSDLFQPFRPPLDPWLLELFRPIVPNRAQSCRIVPNRGGARITSPLRLRTWDYRPRILDFGTWNVEFCPFSINSLCRILTYSNPLRGGYAPKFQIPTGNNPMPFTRVFISLPPPSSVFSVKSF